MGLKQIISQKIMAEVIHAAGGGSHSSSGRKDWRILIVDDQTMRMISSCLKMHELSSEGITIVEQIERPRQALPNMEAIYLITPSSSSINHLIRDFEKKQQYHCAHVFLTEACPDGLFRDLCHAYVSKFVRTLIEIYISFKPSESQVFSLEKPEALSTFYAPWKEPSRTDEMEVMAEQLSTLCYSLGECPSIRYRKTESGMTETFARMLRKKLEAKKVIEPGLGEGRRSQFLILDRGFDATSPILHELTFQAMAYDLLDIKDDIYKYSPSEDTKREVLLDDEDELWSKMRHKHIAIVLENISQKFKDFVKEKNLGKDGATLKDLSQMVKRMPQHQKFLNQFSTQINIAEQCMAKYTGYVDNLCKLEQDLALGTDATGRRITADQLANIVPTLNNPNVLIEDRLRLVLLYLLSKNGTSEENLNKLCQHALITTDRKDALKNLALLGLKIVNTDTQNKVNPPVPRRARRNEDLYDMSRWTPVLKDIVEDSIDGRLDAKLFPSLDDPKQAASQKDGATSKRFGNWYNKGDSGAGGASGRKVLPRLIVFVMGGLSYSEARVAYEVTAEKKIWEVIVGGTSLVTPNQFIKDLQNLSGPVSVSQENEN